MGEIFSPGSTNPVFEPHDLSPQRDLDGEMEEGGTPPETRIGSVGGSKLEYPKPVTPALSHREGAYSRGYKPGRLVTLKPGT